MYFRETFKGLVSSQPTHGRFAYSRQTTYECYENLQRKPVKRQRVGGLKGGRGITTAQQPVLSDNDSVP